MTRSTLKYLGINPDIVDNVNFGIDIRKLIAMITSDIELSDDGQITKAGFSKFLEGLGIDLETGITLDLAENLVR